MYCTKCGKQTDWTSKSGYCKECAASEMDDRTKGQVSEANKTSVSLNGWMAVALISCVVGLICFVGLCLNGNSYISGIAALFFALIAVVLAVIGAAVLIGSINSNKQ